MRPFKRPLDGILLNLSISESGENEALGLPEWQVNRFTLQMVVALFGQGAGVVFGHDWRSQGVMATVHLFAQQLQPVEPLAEGSADSSRLPLLHNVLAWPDQTSVSQTELRRLSGSLRVYEAELPQSLRHIPALHSPMWNRYVRARALTHMRRRLNSLAQARLCIGGRTTGSQGRYPGVIEEALLAVTDRKPLFLAGMLGGAARQVIDAIEQRPLPEDFCHRRRSANDPDPTEELQRVYDEFRLLEAPAGIRNLADDLSVEPVAVWETFQRLKVGGISESNRLTATENQELFHTPIPERAIELVLLGLGRLRGSTRPANSSTVA